MTRIIFFSFIFLFTTIPVFAQSNYIMSAGVHTIMNADCQIDDINIRGGKIGWHIGFDANLGNRIFIQPGLHYYSSSLTVSIEDASIEKFENSAKLQSVKIPINIGLTPFDREANGFSVFIFGGIASTVHLQVVDDRDFVYNEDLVDFNFSSQYGLGTEIGPIVWRCSYESGMNKLFNNSDRNFYLIQTSLGIKF